MTSSQPDNMYISQQTQQVHEYLYCAIYQFCAHATEKHYYDDYKQGI